METQEQLNRQKVSSNQSLQEAFKRFQKQKFYQLKLNKYLQQTDIERSQQQAEQLRAKFLQTAHKYIGVPYSRQYHKPGDPLYDAPLFLDCCAFVKQVVFDLRTQFGFTLGRWNQAYQFDMLPDEKLSEADLKPGDLVFYSATYYDKRIKPFPHNMVHVEIYLGEGRSLGSRWQKGTIQVFDSYKFQSKLYYNIQYHYRSIESWIRGVFKNHCAEHKWLDEHANQWLSDKFSVFADQSLDDLQPSVEKQAAGPRAVFIGKGSHLKVVRDKFKRQVEAQRFFLMPEKDQFSKDFYFKWVQTASEIDFHSFKQGKQLVNHIAGLCVLTNKSDLLKTLQAFAHKHSLDLGAFLPRTYRLDVMSDEIDFINSQSKGIWIYKPRHLNQGKGIRLIGDINQFKKEFVKSKMFYLGQFSLNNLIHYRPELHPSLKTQADKQEPAKYGDIRPDGLIQQYVRPLLLNGFKFDIRCYMLVVAQPQLLLFNPGYLRLTLEKYSETEIQNSDRLFVHLTNNCFQRKHPSWKQRSDASIAKWSTLEDQLGPVQTRLLTSRIQDILRVTYAAALHRLQAKKGQFQLLGCDVLVDENLTPYLLEVNTNPALFLDTTAHREVIPGVVEAVIEINLELLANPDSKKILQKYRDVFKKIVDMQQGGQKDIDGSIDNLKQRFSKQTVE